MAFKDFYSGKRVLITGHTGFKGSWLAIWLKQLGAEVFGYSLPPYTKDDNFITCGLEHQLHHHIGDVRDQKAMQDFFHQVQPDIAFHLAAQPLVLLSYQNPAATMETNLMGVVNFFEAVRNTPSVKAAINITSDKCYDNKEWVWGYRENDPMGGKDPYSASKGAAEIITASYLHSFFSSPDTCNIASARAGNVIGGGDWAADRIVPDFFRSIKAGKKMLLRNPYATRPWQHVLEPLSGYLNLAKEVSENKSLSGGWNFGPEDTANYSVKELIDAMLLLDSTGRYETPEHLEKRHEATFLKLDISKAVNFLNWRPVLSFEETVEFTVNGYKDDRAGGNLFKKRNDQIDLYTNKAVAKNINWSKE